MGAAVAPTRGDTDVNTTAMRLIALRPIGKKSWVKLDARIPYDWENDQWRTTAEVQLGYNVNQRVALYAEGLVGIGKDRPYNGGAGLGVRLKF